MLVVNLAGWDEVESPQELQSLLENCKSGENTYWLSRDRDSYPLLTILVKSGSAAIEFLENELEPGLRSLGDNSNANVGGMTAFRIGPTEADTVEFCNDSLVSLGQAILAAKEFMETGARPTAIRWREY